MKLLSSSISIVSFSVAVILLLHYGPGSEGSFLILAVLGAPSTFLSHSLYWYNGKMPLAYVAVCLLYLFQYQILAFLLYKRRIGIRLAWIIVFILVISIAIMYYMLFGRFG